MANKMMRGPPKSSKLVTKQQVRSMIESLRLSNAELKSWISFNTAVATSTTGTVYPLSQGCVLGDAYNQRDGAQIMPKGLELKIVFDGGLIVTSFARVILFIDTMNSGSLPSVNNVLNLAQYLSTYNALTVYEQKRYVILKDVTVALCPSGQNGKTLDFHFKNLQKISYNGDTDVNSANGKNSIHLLVITSTATPTLTYNSALRYIDQ